MNKKNKQLFTTALFVFLISACSTTKPIKKEAFHSPALDELVEISIEARDELRLLAKMQEAKYLSGLSEKQQVQKYFQATYVPEAFKKKVTLETINTADKVAALVAKLANYSFKIVNKNSRNPLWVRIEIKNKPLYEAIREIAAQTGEQATLEIYDNAKLIRLVYNESI